jgi:hypothetical protein
MKHRLPAFILAAALAACSATTSADRDLTHAANSSQNGTLRDSVSVPLGQSAFADAGRLEIRFDARVADSRCAANVVCVWQGDAHARITTRIAGGAAVSADLHSTLEPSKVVVDRYTITLLGMTPYPGTGQDNASPVLLVRVSNK